MIDSPDVSIVEGDIRNISWKSLPSFTVRSSPAHACGIVSQVKQLKVEIQF